MHMYLLYMYVVIAGIVFLGSSIDLIGVRKLGFDHRVVLYILSATVFWPYMLYCVLISDSGRRFKW